MDSDDDSAIYQAQGFGQALSIDPPLGLLIVDFVVGFTDEAHFGGGNINAAAERTVDLLALARRAGWPVAHTRIVFADDGADANGFSDKVPGLLGLTETAATSQIIPTLKPAAGELVVRKTLPSGFSGTGLQPWLTRKGVRSLLIAGCTTSGCIRASVIDAMNYGLVPVVVRDCVGDRALGPHEANLFDIEQKYGALITVSELEARMAPAAGS